MWSCYILINTQSFQQVRGELKKYLRWKNSHENVSVHLSIFSHVLQIAGLNESKLSSHDPQVGHGLRRLLALQIFHQLVEIAGNLAHQIRDLRK